MEILYSKWEMQMNKQLQKKDKKLKTKPFFKRKIEHEVGWVGVWEDLGRVGERKEYNWNILYEKI